MTVTVKIPTPLRKFTADKDAVLVEGSTVGAALRDLEGKHPGIWTKLCDDEGKVRRFINIYAGDEDIRFQEGLDTAILAGAEISIVPAIAGGR
jgi:molybdopterin synthase sulfur carrier subunit